MPTLPLPAGLKIAFLTLLLTGCGGKIATRVEYVKVPYPQPVPAELTAQAPEPELPEGAVRNEHLADLVADLQEWGRAAYKKLAEIAASHPQE